MSVECNACFLASTEPEWVARFVVALRIDQPCERHRPKLPTADQLEEIVAEALRRGDVEGVGHALRILAVVDPERCERLVAVMKLALEARGLEAS